MSKISDIKYKIDQLDGGGFQNLCDTYLACLGYKNVYSLGMKSGTNKTAKGNPDTYFLNAEGKYIFVMYTTQKTDFCNKAIEDIRKCFNPSMTGVQASEVVEVIYCHTYGRLTPGDDKALRDYCKNNNALLTLKGLDEIATEIYLRYHRIAKDLGVSLDTGQITDVKTFIETHDINKISAPLNTEFMFRNSEKESASSQLDSNNILVISGPSGIGKTRFALEISDIFAKQNGYKILCIKNKHLEIYDDLKEALEFDDKYLLLIDDANELTGLHHILGYLNKEQLSLKIIITVRDYAKREVLRDILEVDKPVTIKLTSLSDDEIRQLMERSFGINNPLYTDRIVAIAEGNARLAMLAGKIASETNNLDKIRDASDLYDSYYGKQIEGILAGNITSIISAGIIAFLQSIYLGKLNHMSAIFNTTGISETQFIEDIKQLHELELVDVCNDKAAKISDQSFGNFLIKYVFVDKKFIPLNVMIEVCFEFNNVRTITACNILLNVFSDQKVQEYIEQEINCVWDSLQTDKDRFLPFFKAFHMVRPTDTLLLMHKQIDSEMPVVFDIQSIDFEKADNGRAIKDDTIYILGSYSNHEQLPEAVDLLLLYYKKRPDLFMQIYWVFTEQYGINKDSERFQYYTQKTVIDHFSSCIEREPTNENVLLFLRIAEYYLKLFYTPTEGGRHNTFIFYRIPLKFNEIVVNYRNRLWNHLMEIYRSGKYATIIEKLIKNYGNEYGETNDFQIIQKDYDFLKCFFKTLFNPYSLHHCIIAEHIKQIGKRAGINNFSELDIYLNSPKYIVYRTLTNEYIDYDIDLEEAEEHRKNKIAQMVSNYSLKDIDFLFQVCKEFIAYNEENAYALTNGLDSVFEKSSKDKDTYIAAVKLYLYYDTPCNLHPDNIVNFLFTIMPSDSLKELILNYNYNQKNAWLWAFFIKMPQNQITKEYAKELLDYLGAPSLELRSSAYRPIDLIDKYSCVDPDIRINASRVINEHYDESPFIFHLYFSLMFNSHRKEANAIIEIYKSDLSLLESIYLKSIYYISHDDYDGSFLLELIENDNNFISLYLDQILAECNKSYTRDYETYIKRLYKIWHCSNFLESINHIVDYTYTQLNDDWYRLPYILRSLFIHEKNDTMAIKNQDEWVEQYIGLNYTNDNLMYSIFSAISELSADRRKKAIVQFITLNDDPEKFERLPLEASHWGGWGSMIPEMESRIIFLSSLLPCLSGLKYLHHKQRIERDILKWRARIKAEEIDELLRY